MEVRRALENSTLERVRGFSVSSGSSCLASPWPVVVCGLSCRRSVSRTALVTFGTSSWIL